MSKDEEKIKKDREVGYLVFPWEVTELAVPDVVLPLLERIHHLGYSPIIASIYLKSTEFYSWDRQISYALIKKSDLILLAYEEHMTPIMLRELMVGRMNGKRVVRIHL